MNRRAREELPGQLALDSLDRPPAAADTSGSDGRQDQRSVGFARCPHGRHPRLTGVVYHGDQLVFRDHVVRLGPSRVPLACRGSGKRLPDGYPMFERTHDG
jgi:hypothetical protein